MSNDPNRAGDKQAHVHELNPSDTSLSHDYWEFNPDHAISGGDKEDRLGFRSVATMLASSLLTQATRQGLVVSIEGMWGSGKSSLVNLLAGELLKNQDQAPSIVRFEPWLIGDRDRMLAELMAALASAVEMIARSDAHSDTAVKGQTKTLAKNMLNYASKFSRQLAPAARLAGHLGIPGAELASKSLEATAAALEPLAADRPLFQLKQELTQGLNLLDRRIVVIIDDLD